MTLKRYSRDGLPLPRRPFGAQISPDAVTFKI
jgi:hypothetical protein